ncbi:MAG: hypothetical protein M1830_001613 [Pleopsidium flavum]|nr:MAG: hypothetical protein M1830_001613 [Pleopsidium flavum]
MSCSGLIDSIPMKVTEQGLNLDGWLWSIDQLIVVKSVIPEVLALVACRPQVQKHTWVLSEFKLLEPPDDIRQLQDFFWILLRKLHRRADCFYGRFQLGFLWTHVADIVDPESGKYLITYELLEEDSFDPYNEEAFGRNQWDKTNDPTDENNYRSLLGDEAQLCGLSWIRDAVLRDGTLAVGHLLSPNTTDSEARMVLSDCKGAEQVFTQYRPVRKYKNGDGKAMQLLHPFDVWLHNRKEHTDAPFCWAATSSEAGSERRLILLHGLSHVLFDIGEIPKSEHVLAWPKEYEDDHW